MPTRFKLPAEDVDMLIAAGADSLRVNNVYTAFLAGMSRSMLKLEGRRCSP